MRPKLLLSIEAFIGIAGVAGGALLAAAPDGRLLGMDPALLTGTPFTDYLVPGLLLALLVGGGGLAGAILTRRQSPRWRMYGATYAIGVVVFELVEYLVIGGWPLQAVIAGLGGIMLLLALTARRAAPDGTRPVPAV